MGVFILPMKPLVSRNLFIQEFIHPVSLYADVELPVFQDFRGNQLAASALFKVTPSYHF